MKVPLGGGVDPVYGDENPCSYGCEGWWPSEQPSSCEFDSHEAVKDIQPIVKKFCPYQGWKSEASNHEFFSMHIIPHDTALSCVTMDVGRIP